MKNKLLILFVLLFGCPIMLGYSSESSKNVTIGNVETPVYDVDITWDSMKFSYNEQINYNWNDDLHIYELQESTYYWSNLNNNVKVTNNSYFDIDVKLNYKSVNDNINGAFDISSANLPNKTSKEFKLILDGKLSSTNDNYIKVGMIELSIS